MNELRILAPVVMLLSAAALPAQFPLSRYDEPLAQQTSVVKYDFALVSDLDQDGLRDVAVRSGSRIEVRSSETGVPLLTFLTSVADLSDGRIASCEDINGNGYREIIAGAMFAAGGAGLVEVFDGFTGQRLHYLVGETSDWRLGASVCATGDVDLDGVPDFAAGASNAPTTGPGGGPQAGRFRVFSGATGAVLFTYSGLGNSSTGNACAALGDLDGDGRPTIAVGASGVERVLLLEPLGDDPIRAIQGTPGSQFGRTLASIADLDGDGGRDLIVGAPGDGPANNGSVAVFGSSSLAPLVHVTGPLQQGFGRHLGAAGDFDLDGVEDIVASGLGNFSSPTPTGVIGWISGASGAATFDAGVSRSFRGFLAGEDADGDGRADLWHGSSAEFRLERLADPRDLDSATQALHGAAESAFGEVLATLGDLDGDGRDELAIAAPYGMRAAAGRRGLVNVMSGETLLYAFDGDVAEHLGAAVAGLDDLDGDGIDEFAIGRPFAAVGQTRCGAVSIYSGATGTLWRAHFGPGWGARFGAAIARVPDTDDDGVDDYAIGGPGTTTTNGGAAAGRVTLFSGATGAVRFARDGLQFRGAFGACLCGIDDLDGDGGGDLLVGAPGEFSSLFTLNAGRVHRIGGQVGSSFGATGGAQAGMRYGTSLAAVGDTTGDGVPEYLVGAPRYGSTAIGDGYVELCDGATGAAIWQDVGSDASRLGTAVGACGDIDNDGFVDFAAGAPRTPATNGGRAGAVRLYSGRTLVHYLTMRADGDGDRFGSALATVADRDQDRLPDLVVGMPGAAAVHPVEGAIAHGAAAVWTARSAGSARFGSGQAGCAGEHGLTLYQPPRPGQTIEFRFSGMSPTTFPVLGFGLPLPVGVPVLGFTAHVQSLFSLGLPLPAGDYGKHFESIPNNPALVGAELHLQLFALWLGGCGALPFDLSSSNGLTVTVL